MLRKFLRRERKAPGNAESSVSTDHNQGQNNIIQEPLVAQEELGSTAAQPSLSSNGTFYVDELESNQFRVLEVHPATYDEPVKCSLHLMNVNSLVMKYDALSYCWGDSNELCILNLDQSDGFVVSVHLYQALRRLRLHKRTRYIWVDAICINQANDREKGMQVQQMSTIFGRAERTVIWLGELDALAPNCRKGQDGICTGPKLLAIEHFEHPRAVEFIRAKLAADERYSLQKAHRMIVWWKRLWVIQEFAASRGSPRVLIGPHAIDWDFFASMRWGNMEPGTEPLPLRLRKSGPHLVRQSLYTLLQETVTDFDCKFGGDRIYALLSLVNDDDHGIKVDYAKTEEYAHAQAAFYLVSKYNTVDVLLDKTDRLRKPDLATWIPIWSRVKPLEDAKGHEPYTASNYHPHVKLSFRYPRSISVVESPVKDTMSSCQCTSRAELTLRCLLFERISTKIDLSTFARWEKHEVVAWNKEQPWKLTTKQFFEDMGPYCVAFGIQPSAMTMKQTEKHVEHELKYRKDAHILRVILDALKIDYSTQPPLDLKRFPNVGYLMLEYIYNGSKRLIRELETEPLEPGDRLVPMLITAIDFGLEPNKAVLRDLKLAYKWEDQFISSLYIAKDAIDNSRVPKSGTERVIFSTDSGFTGLGPPRLEVGDEVVVPFGSSRPWVLRSHGDHHVFIGEAVVPGIMSGRLQGLHEEGEIEAVDYVLR